APYAASLLGHLGADVVKVEPPEGDSNRRRGPFPGGVPDPETSGLHLVLAQAKRGIVLDLDTEVGRAELRRLAAAADVLLASRPGSRRTARRASTPPSPRWAPSPPAIATASANRLMSHPRPRSPARLRAGSCTTPTTAGWPRAWSRVSSGRGGWCSLPTGCCS